jgi:acetyl esterase/lipase
MCRSVASTHNDTTGGTMPQRALPVILLLALLLAPTQAPDAQEGGMPSDIERKLAELGAVIDPAETAKLYTPLQETEPYQGIKVARDLKYGTDERHALDVFAPEQPGAAPRAVLMYVHGGAFIGGSKRAPGSPFFDNIMLFAARNGFVGVNVTYRLAPQHQWPTGAEDVGAAVRWVAANIAAHGGDPGRVFLMGHSAGAVHAASYVAHAKFHGPKGIGLAGAILVSGLYDFAKFPAGAPEKAYFGEEDAKRAEASTVALLPEARIRLLVVYGELDPAQFIEQSKLMGAALCKANRCSSLLVLPKHSHMSEVYAINTKDRVLSDEIAAFVKGGR